MCYGRTECTTVGQSAVVDLTVHAFNLTVKSAFLNTIPDGMPIPDVYRKPTGRVPKRVITQECLGCFLTGFY